MTTETKTPLDSLKNWSKYDEENGYTFTEDQTNDYLTIHTFYSYGDPMVGKDYIWIDGINGIDYYTPNNEDWGPIIAMDHKHQLAVNTSFYEMDDMAYEDSEYAFIFWYGKLIPRFEQQSTRANK